VGQEHVKRALRNAVLHERVGHAYLFVGPRGIGKTTIARIFAKTLNCEALRDAEPCCTCQSCREIAAGNSLDLIEIDAASNRGVDSIRNLRESVLYTPSRSRYKVYIIDEVHMLTKEAWNALLKTLEEPPPHVKFLFATTEPHKVLPTILSRCQRFDLRRIPVNMIAGHLRMIADTEKVFVEPAALAAIARAADGGMRDGQSIFDQMIAFCGGTTAEETITEQDVIDVFGLASSTELHALISGIDHRIETHNLGMRDLTDSVSTRAAAEGAGADKGQIDVAELYAPFSHQEIILSRALGLGEETQINPSGGVLAGNLMMASGLSRIGEVFSRIVSGEAQRGLAHATSGPCLQHNLVAVLEGVA